MVQGSTVGDERAVLARVAVGQWLHPTETLRTLDRNTMDRPHAGPSEIARTFLKIGAMSYGGPAIMGIMQAEIQEKRQWIDKTRFVEGLALVNMLPGPGATQLGIFIGHAMAGTVGGILAGVCFIAPAFFIMLALAFAYETWGALPAIRSAFYGIGPVVLGVFALAVYRLGRNAVRDKSQIAIAVAAATAMVVSPLGIIMTLMLAGCAGIAFYDSRRDALVAAAIVLVGIAIAWGFDAAQVFAGIASPDTGRSRAGLADVGVFFFKVGAFTFGGGLSMLAFIEDQVVNQLGWLTHREFVDGLALGQLTPGPILTFDRYPGRRRSRAPLLSHRTTTVTCIAKVEPCYCSSLSFQAPPVSH